MKTAGIIRNEILSGHTQDTNVYFIAKQLFNLNIHLKQVVISLDNPKDIASNVSSFSQKYDYVFTAGGLGCTLDDLTMQGIATAFNSPLIFNQQLYDILCKAEQNVNLNSQNCVSSLRKMAHIPENAKLHLDGGSSLKYPLMSCGNVFVLPGPPIAVMNQFRILRDLMKDDVVDEKFYQSSCWFKVDEKELAYYLKVFIEKNEGVEIGCYPRGLTIQIILTLKEDRADKLMDEFLESIPDHIIRINDPTLKDLFTNTYPDVFKAKLNNSIKVIETAISKYGLKQIALSFNGGKDCTLLLYLLNATIKRYYQEHIEVEVEKMKTLYVMVADPFIEIEEFVDDCCERYPIDLERVNQPMKEALKTYLDTSPHLKAIFIGTRRTDPYAENLGAFEMTDKGWPDVMRIHPVLDWTYEEVWMFLKSENVGYCQLYDQGYTSIGGLNNTQPNGQLVDPQRRCGYKPAYMLMDGSKERDGRGKK